LNNLLLVACCLLLALALTPLPPAGSPGGAWRMCGLCTACVLCAVCCVLCECAVWHKALSSQASQSDPGGGLSWLWLPISSQYCSAVKIQVYLGYLSTQRMPTQLSGLLRLVLTARCPFWSHCRSFVATRVEFGITPVHWVKVPASSPKKAAQKPSHYACPKSPAHCEFQV
jgi:hypothetical protein